MKRQMPEPKIAISESTPVRIGLVLVFLGAFASAVWWAASINAKLDAIITNQSNVGTSISELKAVQVSTAKDLSELALRVAILESKASEPVGKK